MTFSRLFVFFSLGAPPRLDVHVEFCEDESVVSPAVCATHGFSHPNILPVPSPDYDVVYKTPMLATWVHPGRLVSVG